MSVDNGLESGCQPCVGIDGVELASFDQRRQHCPVLRTCIVTCEESVFAVQRDGADSAFDGVAVDLDVAVIEEPAKPVPVFGDVFGGLAERRLGRDAGAMGGEPGLKIIDNRF